MNKKKFVIKTCLTQLSSVEEKIRNKGLRSVQQNLDQISKDQFRTLSLGLYYFYWYSDKSAKQLQFLWDLRRLFAAVARKCDSLYWEFLGTFLDVVAEKFTKIDVYRAPKFLLLAKSVFHLMYGLDLESVLFDTDFKDEAKTLETYSRIWAKETLRGQLRRINGVVKSVLMQCSSRTGLMLQYVYSVRDLFQRLHRLGRFKMMKELFLFVKPLLNLAAFTLDKKIRGCLKRDFLEHLLKLLRKKGNRARERFAKFVLVYAKSPDLSEINRKMFYDFLEEVEKKTKKKKPRKMPVKRVKSDQDNTDDLESELDLIDKELQKKPSEAPQEPTLDIQTLNVRQLLKRSYDKFAGEAHLEDEDESYSPSQDLQIEGLCTENDTLEMGSAEPKSEENNYAEQSPVGSETEEQDDEAREKSAKPQMNGAVVKMNGAGGSSTVFEMDLEQFNESELPELDVEEENGELLFGGNMSFEEMQEKLPEYYFKSPKQKRKYFRKLTLKYKKRLDKSSQGSLKRRKIKFDLSQNQKKVFAQRELIKRN